MGSWSAFLFAYLLGGLTFLPLVIVVVLLHAKLTLPRRTDVEPAKVYNSQDDIVQPGDDTSGLEASKDVKKATGLDVAAGYFAVCREYTPMGINAKPIERSTPVGSTTVASPSQSVYQTMYKSIFERKGPTATNQESGGNGVSQRPKKAGNVFYVVLRHGHLMLFDDDEQIEVRHVISLAHHDISVYSGGDVTPEGELWIKRNSLCLSRKPDGPDMAADIQTSKPFYLFSENCSAKEDFYFALLKNQEQTFGAGDSAPAPKQFDVKNIISLVQRLHSSEDNVHSRWLNALIGRVFLGVYKTKDIENFIIEKLTKKISRVKRPNFLTKVVIQKIDTGEAAPYFTNLKLRDLAVEGECVVEADVKYLGNFRLEVAATAKIDLGPRFKAREVNLVLAVMLKKLEGHMLFKIKPPPSNRLWFSFQTMPKMEMAIEPIVSSRQITYTVILRQIESRIKEVFAETLVQPFWDDMPFFKTEHKDWRGGIFENDDALPPKEKNAESVMAQTGDVETTDRVGEHPDLVSGTLPMEKSHSLPVLDGQAGVSGLFGRKFQRSSNQPSPSASTTSVDAKSMMEAGGPRSPEIVSRAHEPIVKTDATHADLYKPSTSPPDHATSYMTAIHSRAQDSSPAVTPSISPPKAPSLTKRSSHSSASSSLENISDSKGDDEHTTPIAQNRRSTASSADAASLTDIADAPNSPSASKSSFLHPTGSLGRNFFLRRENSNSSTAASSTTDDNQSTHSNKKNTLAAVTNAAIQARQWGWNAIQKQKEARKNNETPPHLDLSQPMGRGQPLPPPGTPLPKPKNGLTKIGPMPAPKRKPVPEQPEEQSEEQHPPPLPNRRRRMGSMQLDQEDRGPEQVFVVEAPDDSEPNTPAVDERTDFAESWGDSSAPPTQDTVTASRDTDDDSRDTPQNIGTPTDENIKLDEPLVATPAADSAEEEDDDDYSGWMDNEPQEETASSSNEPVPQQMQGKTESTIQGAPPLPKRETKDGQ